MEAYPYKGSVLGKFFVKIIYSINVNFSLFFCTEAVYDDYGLEMIDVVKTAIEKGTQFDRL